jgi:hypothetical protein
MEQRSEDFQKRSMQEMVGSVIENRAWSKQLRINNRILVNSRLARLIGADEYSANRRLINENIDECKRRGIILLKEITVREDEGSDVNTVTLNSPAYEQAGADDPESLESAGC